MIYCELCGGKLDGRACPLCGEAACPKCNGPIGDCGWCVRCDGLPMTDAQLDGIVGGMGVVGGISLGLGLVRVIQARRLMLAVCK